MEAGGGGGDEENNGGAGFGLGARPVGAYVIKNGEVSWRPAIDVNRLFAMAFILGLALVQRRRR